MRKLARKRVLKTFLITFIFSICVLNGRNWVVSSLRAGTPFFPLFTCQIFPTVTGCQGLDGISIQESANLQLGTKNAYGIGRGLVAFVKHLWLISVPTNGVMNEYDYPLGLPWLFWCVLALLVVLFSVRKKNAEGLVLELPFQVLFSCAIGWWAAWWIGSQQARWLYPTLYLGLISVLPYILKLNYRIVLLPILISVFFSTLSSFRNLRPGLTANRAQIYEEQIGKASWSGDHTINQIEFLYFNEPIFKNTSSNRYWILPVVE